MKIGVRWDFSVPQFVVIYFCEVGPDESGEDESIKDFTFWYKIWIDLLQSWNIKTKYVMTNNTIIPAKPIKSTSNSLILFVVRKSVDTSVQKVA